MRHGRRRLRLRYMQPPRAAKGDGLLKERSGEGLAKVGARHGDWVKVVRNMGYYWRGRTILYLTQRKESRFLAFGCAMIEAAQEGKPHLAEQHRSFCEGQGAQGPGEKLQNTLPRSLSDILYSSKYASNMTIRGTPIISDPAL